MSPAEPFHIPVLAEEAVKLLVRDPAGAYLDATAGLGGHSAAVLARLGAGGRLLALDWDPAMAAACAEKLSPFGAAAKVVTANFAGLAGVLKAGGGPPLAGALFDLGISSVHYGAAERGFGFSVEGPLDMRINRGTSLTARAIVNEWPPEEIEKVLREFGEEKNSFRIAAAIVRAREGGPVETTFRLREIVEKLYGRSGPRGIHPATRTFMALRIAVNSELENLGKGLDGIADFMAPGGRIGVISFHSLEDRIVKRHFLAMAAAGGWTIITRKPVLPSEREVEGNPRARSAKLRVIERSGGAPEK